MSGNPSSQLAEQPTTGPVESLTMVDHQQWQRDPFPESSAEVVSSLVVTGVRHGDLPDVWYDETSVMAVLHNLIGIEPQYRERVFGMFARLHVREAYAGTGIGLAIVQQVAERSGGHAWVEQSHLGGSRFCVTLPAVPGEEPPE